MASNPVTKLTVEEYLALDRAAERKSEFFYGEMFAMSGVSMPHARLQTNLTAELFAALRGADCEVFGSDLRVRVSKDMYVYPDVAIVCGTPILGDQQHQDILLNPIVLFEVLSPTTETYDRGLKFQNYRTIESLKEYILVDQAKVRVEQYFLQPDNTWSLRDYKSLDGQLEMPSIDVSIPLARIYDRVELPAS